MTKMGNRNDSLRETGAHQSDPLMSVTDVDGINKGILVYEQ